MKALSFSALLLLIIAAQAFATVVVRSPANEETVSTTATYVVTGTCSQCVASMGGHNDDDLVKVVNGNQLSASIALTGGNLNMVVL